jgi:pilus assembly protein CpaF
MPLLDRLSATPDDDSNQDQPKPEGVSPLIPGRSGRPAYSLEALRERIERQFIEETAGRPDILSELDSEEAQRAQIREVADYVLAQDAIYLDHRLKADLIDRAYRNLFSFGPLDSSLLDPDVTEIEIDGPRAIHVRRRMGKRDPVQPAFDDALHLEAILERLLVAGGIALSKAGPFVEVGAELKGRPARITLVGPPVNPGYSLTLRLHPSRPLALDDLASPPALIPLQAAGVLRAIVSAKRGLLIVGDPGAGKTTLARALVAALPSQTRIAVAERAAEMRLPPSVTQHTGADFVAAIRAAAEDSPEWLVVDEIRGDESVAVWDILSRQESPRLIGVFRGPHRPDRLISALTMLIRREQPTLDQREIIAAVARHFPFVALLRSSGGAPELSQIAALRIAPSGESLALRPLLAQQNGVWTLAPDVSGFLPELPSQ